MDELVQIGLSELALEGAQGCQLERFFDLIHLRISSTFTTFLMNLKFDEKMKKYLFELIKSIKDVSVRQEDDIKALDFNDPIFQKNTTLIASKALQNAESGMDKINITWTDQLKRIFKKVSSSRENGITQTQLAKDEDLDPRSCFHYIKVLVHAKVCVKIPILTTSGISGSKVCTNLILHSKFKNTSPAYISFTRKRQQMDRIGSADSLIISNESSLLDDALQNQDLSTRIDKRVIIEKMKVLLESAKNKVLRLDEFMAALSGTSTKSRRSLGAIVRLLKNGGYVKTFDVPDHEKGSGFVSCIQMLQPLPIGDDVDERYAEINSTFFLISDLPLETQILDIITESGSEGISSASLMYHFSPHISYKVLMKVIGLLQGYSRNKNDSKKQNPYIKSMYDFDGKIRTSRYFSLRLMDSSKEKGKIKTSRKGKEIIRAADPLKCIQCPNVLDLNMNEGSTAGASGFCSKECETVFLVITTPAAESPSKSFVHGLASKSITSLRKSKYIENIIERVRIIECGKNFFSLIDEESEAHGEVVKYRIDKKTIDRILKTLQEEKKVNVIEASTIFLGRKRRFITHPSINSADDPEFQEFLKSAAEEYTRLQSSYSSKANREVQMDMEVDSLKRIEEPVDSLDFNEPNLSTPMDLNFYDEDVHTLNPNEILSQTFFRKDDPGWIEIAIKNGYVVEKYQKVKLFHFWLFDISRDNNHTLLSVDLFDSFPLQLYFQVVGVRKSDGHLNRLVRDEKNSTYSLSNVPSQLRHLIIGSNLKRSLVAMMHSLSIFGFVECLEMKDGKYDTITSQELNLAVYYRILRKVPFTIDFFKGSFSSEKITVKDLKELEGIWENLQNNVKSIESGKKKFVDAKFRNVIILRNWESRGLSVYQRQSMLKLTNPNNGSTPLRHNQLCSALAAKLNLELDVVKKFYVDFESKFKREKLKKQNSDSKTSKNSISLKKANLTFQNSTIREKEQSENIGDSSSLIVVKSFTKADYNIQIRKEGNSLSNDENNEMQPIEPLKGLKMHAVPVSSPSSALINGPPKSNKRKTNWSVEEDDLLCYGYVVMLKNQKGRGISSQLARKLLPNRMDIHPDAPRRRINQLKDQAELQDKFQFISSQWEPFQQQAMKNNQWYANVTKEYLDASFLVLCEEFKRFCTLQQMADEYSKDQQNMFMADERVNSEEKEQMGHIILGRDHLVSDNSIPIDEGLEVRSSRAGKFAFLNTISFSIPKSEKNSDYDYDAIDSTDIRYGLAAGLLKMIMMISEENYNAEQTFFALKENFEDTDIAIALDMLKSLSTTTRAQRSQNVSDRRVPVRACQISEKALSVLNGQFSEDFLEEARSYWKFISSGTFTDADITENCNSGIMAVITDTIFSNDYSIETPEEIPATLEGPVNDIHIQLKKISFAVESFQQKRKNSESDSSLETKKGRMASKVEDPVGSYEVILDRLGKENDIEQSYLKEIYGSISAGGFMGKNIKEINDDTEHEWTRTNLEVMMLLLLRSKIILMVGINHPRYVCAEYELDWSVFITTDSKSDFIRPDLWNNLDGTVNRTLYHQCLNSVFQIIFQKPGITEKNLYKKMSILFGRMELHQLLENLISDGRISKFVVTVPQYTTGLLDGLFSKGADEKAFGEEVTSFTIKSFNKDL